MADKKKPVSKKKPHPWTLMSENEKKAVQARLEKHIDQQNRRKW